jgi:putative transposase
LADSLPRSVLERWASENLVLEKWQWTARKVGESVGNQSKRGDSDVAQAASLRTPATAKAPQRPGALQASRSRSLSTHRQRFIEYEELLHKVVTGPIWLKEPGIAKVVADAIHHGDDSKYRLDAYSIMPNHAHMVFAPNPVSSDEEGGSPSGDDEDHALASIMHSLKSYTANENNKLLRRTGGFWERENFDHFIRDEREWLRTIAYVLNNPVKAGLAQDWREWPYGYCRLDLG